MSNKNERMSDTAGDLAQAMIDQLEQVPEMGALISVTMHKDGVLATGVAMTGRMADDVLTLCSLASAVDRMIGQVARARELPESELRMKVADYISYMRREGCEKCTRVVDSHGRT